MTTLLQRIKRNVSADSIYRQKDGTIIFRRGYFYRHGMTPEAFRDKISSSLKKIGIDHSVVDYGDHWTPFNGGASLSRSSHFYVRVRVEEKKEHPEGMASLNF